MPPIIRVLVDSSSSLFTDTLFAAASIMGVILYTGLTSAAIILTIVLTSATFNIPAFEFIATMTTITALTPFMVFTIEAVASSSSHPTTSTTAAPESSKSPPRDLDSQIFVAITSIAATTLLHLSGCTTLLGLVAEAAIWVVTLLCDRTNNALSVITVAASIVSIAAIAAAHAHYGEQKSAVFALGGIVAIAFATGVAQVSAWVEEVGEGASGKGLFRTAVMATLLAGTTTVGVFLLVLVCGMY